VTIPEGFRFKLIILFILQGMLVFALSFTHSYAAVIATAIFMGIIFALWLSRSLTMTLKDISAELYADRETGPSAEKDGRPDTKKKEDEDEKVARIYGKVDYEARIAIKKWRDEAEYLAFFKDKYDEMADTLKVTTKQLDEQKTQIEGEKEKIEIILRSVPDGVVTINAERRFISWNPGATDITEWEPRKAENTLCTKIFKLYDKAGNELSEPDSPIEECFTTKQIVDRSGIFLKTPSGKIKPIDIKIAPAGQNVDQGVQLVVVTFRDISKKWEIEKFKEDFLATVTHDLKSPLAAVVGYTNLLLHPKQQFSKEQEISFLTSILGSVKILQFLIDNILETARLESGRIVYQFEDFHLPTLLSEIETMFAPIVNSKKLTLQISSDDLWVYGDREKLREVMNNLISNAVKFTAEEGRITISAAKQGDCASIQIADTGKGIPAEEIPKLFNKFVQVKGERRGTGLGLYIVKKIVEDHEQHIEVASTFGKGTEFSFTLKLGTPKEAVAATARKTSGKRKAKILIVEDDPAISSLIRYHLRAAGYETKQVFQGGDVPAMIEKEKPNLITLDYDLPDINGEEVIKRMTRAGKKIHIPIMIITANVKKSWEIPYDCLLPKPLDEARFLSEVDRLLSKKISAIESVEVLH
jgi:signal transduction histidine kinase